MKLSVVVIFFNNKREAPRTLHSLTRTYQKNISLDYEVLAIDSNSTEPLDAKMVESFGTEFSYHFVKTPHPSPVEALRRGLELSKGEYIMVIIDGAHILTPGIMTKWKDAIKSYPASMVYTQRYHLGKYLQNDNQNHNQTIEDALLNSVDWKNNGYELFRICHLPQSGEWWFSMHVESNCFIIPRKKLIEHGSIYKDYFSVGGGFLNMEMFKKAAEDTDLTTVILMGESTFHQFHGGTTTNITREEIKHKLIGYRKEYFDLNQSHYGRPKILDTHYFGNVDESVKELLKPAKRQTHYRKIVGELVIENKIEEAIFLMNRAVELYPFYIPLISGKARLYQGQGKYDEALEIVEKGLNINKLEVPLLLFKGEILLSQNKIAAAAESFELCYTVEPQNPTVLMKLSKIHLKKGEKTTADQYIEAAVKRVEELKIQDKFLNVFTFLRNNNYKALARKMLDFSDDISGLAHNFEFVLSKTEYLTLSPQKRKMTDQLMDLYYNSKVSVNQANRMADLLIQQNRRKALWQMCEQLEQDKFLYQSHYLKAKWYFRQKKPRVCLSEINAAFPHASTVQAEAACYNMRARCQLKLQQLEACLTNINKAIQVNPNNAVYLSTKAKAHLELKQHEKAKVLYERIADISNYNLKFDALLYLFDIAFQQKKYEQCESYLTQAAKVKPKNERIQQKRQALASVQNA